MGLLINSINIKLDLYAVEPRFKPQLEPYFSLLQMYDNKHYIFHMSYLKTPMFDDLKQSITLKILTHCVCLNVCNFDNRMFYSQNFKITGLLHIISNTMADSMLVLCSIVNLF